MSAQTRPTLLQLVQARDAWRARLEADYADTARRLQTAYRRTLVPLRAQLGALADDLDHLDELSPARVRGLRTYADLTRRMEAELQAFAQLTRSETGLLADAAARHGTNGARELALAQVGPLRFRLAGAWLEPAPEALERLASLVDSDAMRARMAAFGRNAADQFGDTMLSMVAQGKNPVAIARAMNTWFALPFAWAETHARTAQLHSYRAANHATYAANSRLLDGWVWWSAADTRTCPACWSQHGTLHSLDERLDGHHRCRCTPVPVVRGTTWRDDVPTGEARFAALPEAEQRQILGPGLFQALRRGEVAFAELSTHYHDDVYGDMRRTVTLKELRVREPA